MIYGHNYDQGADVRGWPKVIHSGQDCRIPPTRHGLYGQNGHGHREREREIEDARSIRDAGASGKRKEDRPSSSLRNKHKTSIP